MEFNKKNLENILNYSKNVLKNCNKNNYKNHLKKSLNILKNLNDSKELNKYNLDEEITELLNLTEKEYKKINVFKLISKSNVNKLKKFKNFKFNELNNEGNTILHHSIKMGDTEILKILLKNGGNIDSVNGYGHTLLEYSCILGDPNMINNLTLLGSNMDKHLFFREGNNKFYLQIPYIDIAILLKILIYNSQKHNNFDNFKFLLKYFNSNELIGLANFKFFHLLIGLDYLFKNKMDKLETYKQILIEELDYYQECKENNIDTCYYNKISIITILLIPFINYPFNISCDFILKNELKFIINKLKNNNKKNYKNLLFNYIFKNYINNNLFKEDYIGIIVYQILKN